MKIITLFLILLSNIFVQKDKVNLSVQIDNIQTTNGVIWIGIYDSADSFLDKDRAILKRVEINHLGEVLFNISDLSIGSDYAIAVLHDINGNGDLDRNFFGIPTEPFAFSGRIRSSWRAPKFDEVKFEIHSYQQSLSLHLKSWWDF